MSRPRILISKPLLNELYLKHIDGVKYLTLTKKYNLPISSPTLKTLLKFYDISQTIGFDTKTKGIILDSLFPPWLIENIQTQDQSEWLYRGDMPFGYWEKIS